MIKYIISFVVVIGLIIVIGKQFGPEYTPQERTERKPKTVVARPPVGNVPAPIKNNWSYSEHVDKMTSKKVYSATSKANNLLDFEFPYDGGSIATIVIRKNNSTDVMLNVSKGQFKSNYSGGTIRARFDDNPAKSYKTSPASDGSSDVLFILNESNFIANIKRSKKLLIEAEFYREGNRQIEFNIENLKWNH